jgi:hypothetical protein
MKNRLLALGLSAGLALLACHGVLAQSAPKTQPIATNAPRPRAILAQNNSIRFELPLTRPAVAGERAVAWLLFPDGFAWGETSVALREGSRSASLTLPWPWDKRATVCFVKEMFRGGRRFPEFFEAWRSFRPME